MSGVAYRIADLPIRQARRIVVDPVSGCWLWQGAHDHLGYGRTCVDYKSWLVHRLVYTLLVGEIPDGLVLDHVKARGCISTSCCWPEHLEPVTQQENLLRGDTFSAANAAKTHCSQGHPYDEVNTYPHGAGRGCRACFGWQGGLRNRDKTHCRNGHEFTPENTYVVKTGSRQCRTCKRETQRRYESRKQAMITAAA